MTTHFVKRDDVMMSFSETRMNIILLIKRFLLIQPDMA
jgi:hypothetical protein